MTDSHEEEVRNQIGVVHENYTQIALLREKMESTVKADDLLRTQHNLEKELRNEINELKLFITEELKKSEITTLKWFLKTWMTLTSTAVVILTSVFSAIANFLMR